MKSIFLYIFLFIFSFNARTQEVYIMAAVDEAPTIKECYDPTKDSKECFNQNIYDFVVKNLNTLKMGDGDVKVYVTLQISEIGAISNIKVRAKDKEQEEEVKRVLTALKIATPATLDGKAVAVSHAFPVTVRKQNYDSYSAFFETLVKDLPKATETKYPPLFENCATTPRESSCFVTTLESLIKKSIKAKTGTVLNYYLEINKNAAVENVVVMSHNAGQASDEAKIFLENLLFESPARNEQKEIVKSCYYGKLIF